MTNFLKPLSAIGVAISVCACSAINAPTEKAEDTNQELLIAKGKRDYVDNLPNVHSFSAMYVPELTAEEASLPKWYDDFASVAVDGLELQQVLSMLLEGKDLRVEYRPGVLEQKKVSIAGEHSTIGGYLEALASATGYQVEPNGNAIIFSKYVERVFPIRSITGNYEFAIGKKGETSLDSQSQSSQNATSEAVKSHGEEYGTLTGEFDPLDSFKKGVEIILGCKAQQSAASALGSLSGSSSVAQTLNEDIEFQLTQNDLCDSGSKVEKLESDNSLLVRALPSQMQKVDKFIAEKTERELRQVRLDVTLVAVELKEDTALSLDLSLKDSVLGNSDFGIMTKPNTGSSLLGGMGNLGSAVLSHTSGTNLALQALSEQGTILDKTVLRGVAANHRLMKITDVKKRSYIADRRLAQTADVGTTTSIEQEVVESGRVLYAVPNIGPSDVLVKLSTSLSSLLGLDTKGEEGNQVESPEISDREIEAIVQMKPGRPVLVGGFSVKETQTLKSLNGTSGFTRSSSGTDVELVMVVEAVYL